MNNIKRAINALCDELDKNRANLKSDDVDVQHTALLRDDEIHCILSQLYDERSHVSDHITNDNLASNTMFADRVKALAPVDFTKINMLLEKARGLTSQDQEKHDQNQGCESIFNKSIHNKQEEPNSNSEEKYQYLTIFG